MSQKEEELKFNIVGTAMKRKDEGIDNYALHELAMKSGKLQEDYKYYQKYSAFSKTARSTNFND